jgi:hypothetical protein
VIGIHPSSVCSPCPFRIIVIGSPFIPDVDQLFVIVGLGEPATVLPKRIEFPHLPSCIKSPSKGNKGCMLGRS